MTVTVFTKPHCPQCDATKRQLTKLGVPFETVDLTQNPSTLEQLQAAGFQQAPVVMQWCKQLRLPLLEQRCGQPPAQVLFVGAQPHRFGHAPGHGLAQGRLGPALAQALERGRALIAEAGERVTAQDRERLLGHLEGGGKQIQVCKRGQARLLPDRHRIMEQVFNELGCLSRRNAGKPCDLRAQPGAWIR